MTDPGNGVATAGTFWRQQTVGALPFQSLPRDRKVLGNEVGKRLCHEQALDPALWDDLRRGLAVPGGELKELLLTGFLALLFRQTGHSDVVVGVWEEPVGSDAARRGPEQMLPVRESVRGGQPFAKLLEQVRVRLAEARRLGPGPGRDLVGTAVAEDAAGGAGTIPAAFALTFPRGGNGLESSSAPTEDPFVAAVVLGLQIHDTEGHPGLRWHYDSGRYQAGFIGWMSQHYVQLLRDVIRDPGTPVEDLVLVSPEEEAFLHGWSQGAPDTGCAALYHERLRSQAERTPDAVAVVHGTEQLTFRELEIRANQLAHHLQSLGVGPDVIVALCLERSLDLVVAAFAVPKAGGGVLLLDPDAPVERLSLHLEWVRPGVVVSHRKFPGLLDDGSVRWVFPRELPAWLAGRPVVPPVCRATAESVSMLFTTSGSTGRPKLVVQAYGHYRAEEQRDSKDRLLLKSSSGTTFTSFEILTIISGATLFIVPEGVERDLAELVRFIGEHGITQILLAPSALGALLSLDDLTACRSLQSVLCVGEMITPDLKRRFFGRLKARLLVAYGCTEARGATSRFCGVDDDPALVDAGRTDVGMEVYVLDGNLRLAAVGIPGEIHIGGQIARGYLNEAEATAHRFIPHPFRTGSGARLFRTGDLRRRLPDDTLELLGRLDHQVKIRGFRVELGEVEAAIGAYPGVRECVVIAAGGVSGDLRLVAYVVSGTEVPAGEGRGLREFLLQRLPEPMVPATYIMLDRLPLTPNGKVDRQALPAPESTGVRGSSSRGARTPSEEAVAAIWTGSLGVTDVGVDDDFFESGGTSLNAVRLLAGLEKRFGLRLTLADLLRHPTVAALAGWVSEPGNVGHPTVGSGFRGTRVGTGAPVFHVPGLAGFEFLSPPLAAVIGGLRPYFDGLQFPGLNRSPGIVPGWEEITSDLVRQIGDVWPEGPLCLSGFSWGGAVAYEVACRLTRAGRKVESVILLDSWVPKQWPRRSRMGMLRVLAGRVWSLPPRMRGEFLWGVLWNTAAKPFRRAALRVPRPGPAPAATESAPDPVLDSERRWAATLETSLGSRLGPYAGRVVLLRATQVRPNEELGWARPPLNGWDEIVQGELVVRRIPCFHHDMFIEPVHPGVLEALREELGRGVGVGVIGTPPGA